MANANKMGDNERLDIQRQAMETLYRAFSEKNPDLMDIAVTADWQDIPLAPGQGPGPDGLKPIIGLFIQAMPDVNIIVHDIIQVAGRAAVRAEISGTHLGPLFGIAATGKKVSFSLHEFHEFEGGRIKKTWHLEDWFGLFQQLGSFPPMDKHD